MTQHSQLNRSSRRDGFTLVELSIVLVIIGLLAGGILAGTALIRSYEIRQVTTEVEKYSIAATTFQSRYKAYPGDFTKAVDYWGHSSDCGGGDSRPTATCNGNGNGMMYTGEPDITLDETYLFWQHLTNSGLLPGESYTGRVGTGAAPGVNIPLSAMGGNSGWWGGTIENFFASPSTPTFGRSLHVTALTLQSYPQTTPGVLTPSEAQAMDIKIDDSKVFNGMFRAHTAALLAASSSRCAVNSGGAFLNTPALINDASTTHLGDYAAKQAGDEIECPIMFAQPF